MKFNSDYERARYNETVKAYGKSYDGFWASSELIEAVENGWIATFGYNEQNSDTVAESNFSATIDLLNAGKYRAWTVWRFGRGHVIAVKSGTKCAAMVMELLEYCERSYPLVNDEHHSNLEYEMIQSEIDYCIKYYYTGTNPDAVRSLAFDLWEGENPYYWSASDDIEKSGEAVFTGNQFILLADVITPEGKLHPDMADNELVTAEADLTHFTVLYDETFVGKIVRPYNMEWSDYINSLDYPNPVQEALI